MSSSYLKAFNDMWITLQRVHEDKGVVVTHGDLLRYAEAIAHATQGVEVLREYASPLNWDELGNYQRVWLEFGSSTRDCYDGFDAAGKHLRANDLLAPAGSGV